MKKRLGFCALLMSFSALLVGLFAVKNQQNYVRAEAVAQEVESQIVSVQMRSGGSDLSYLVVLDSTIDISQGHMSKVGTNYNAPNYINVYLSEDGEAIPLSSFINNEKQWDINLWTSGGVMFPINDANYEIYNGTTVYAIEILEGCTYPNNKSQTVVVNESYRYINGDYGNPDAKNEAFHFSLEPGELVNLGDIGISGVHNRMDKDSGYRWLMLFVDDSIFNVSMTVDNSWIARLNFMDNISIYLSESGEPLKLKDIYDPTTTGVTLQLFGQKTMFAVSISNEKDGEQYRYCGPKMFKMIIEEGTQIPSYENGVAGYRVIGERSVLINGDYGQYGEILDTMDDYGNPRLYEEWNLNWNLASCYVTFTVVGIEGLSYPDMLLEYGQRVSLKDFAVNGYDLVATTTAGDTIYQYIIGTNHNFNVILTYSVHKDEGGEKKGCGGSIAISSVATFMASLAAALFFIRKRRGNEE